MAQPVRTHVHVRIEAPRDVVWSALTDIELQPAWMRDARGLEIVEGDPAEVAPGLIMKVPTQFLGMKTIDVMETIAVDAPLRWEVQHIGESFKGRGEFTLVDEDDGRATTVYWTEEIEAPAGLVGEAALTAIQPLLRRQFKHDLHRFRRIIESSRRRGEQL